MTVVRLLGGALLVGAAACFLIAALLFFDSEPDARKAQLGFVALGILAGAPGAALFGWARARIRQAEFEEAVLGLVRAHDRFTIAEIARKIGRTELEAGELVARLDARRDDIELVFHRTSGEYLHRARIDRDAVVIDACPSCGAAAGRQVLFRDEQVACAYCDRPLR